MLRESSAAGKASQWAIHPDQRSRAHIADDP
jgi:hypothetical protein